MNLPGLKARGYTVERGSGSGADVEHETFTCCHCGGGTIIPHRATPEQLGRFCLSCNQMTCMKCAKDQRCTPFMRRIERSLSRERLYQSL